MRALTDLLQHQRHRAAFHVAVRDRQRDTLAPLVAALPVTASSAAPAAATPADERFAALALLALEKATLYAKVTRELAERKKAEARIRESQQRYRSFLEESPDPIVVYDMQGVASYVNPAFEQTFGRSRHELLGKQIDFVPEECWPETKAAIDRMLSGGKIVFTGTVDQVKSTDHPMVRQFIEGNSQGPLGSF